jgi:non-heme chloroperoxidase
MAKSATSKSASESRPSLTLFEVALLAESRGLAPRFFRLAAKNMAINTSGRDVNDAIFARLPRPQFAAFGFGLGKLATCSLLSSSADRSMFVLLSSKPNVPWGKPTGLICSKSATSKLTLRVAKDGRGNASDSRCATLPDFHIDSLRSVVTKTGVSPHCDYFVRSQTMPTITTKDGTVIYYKDWGSGQPVVFSHGWPLTADAWEDQMVFLAEHGYRCIAHDRRGHGRSSQPWNGNDMNTYADDLATLAESLDLKNAVHVGHSTGGGEVARYIGRHGSKRVAKAVLIGAVTPLMLKTAANPGGLPMQVFDEIRAKVLADRSQFFQDLTTPFYGANRSGAKVSQGLRDSFWRQGMQAGFKGVIDCIKAFSETDFTEDLKKLDVPTLILHGDDDQIVPIDTTAKASDKLIKNSQLKAYAGGSHGICSTHKNEVNADLLAFLKA